MHPYELTFRRWEPYLEQIVRNYPEPTTIHCSTLSPSTVRQGLQKSIKFLCENQFIDTVIPIHRAELVHQTFAFVPYENGTVIAGPKQRKASHRPLNVGLAVNPQTSSIIDCSNKKALDCILYLKNFDILSIPITLTNFIPEPDIQVNYPNVEFVPNSDGSFTIL